MADDELNDSTYLGFPRFSSVPEGLISHIASWPGQLCSICDALDIASYYTTGGPTLGRNLSHKTLSGDDVDGTIHDSCLGTYGEVSRRALACDFCQLVIKALANTTATELQRRSQNVSKVFLDSVLAGSYFKGSRIIRQCDWRCSRRNNCQKQQTGAGKMHKGLLGWG